MKTKLDELLASGIVAVVRKIEPHKVDPLVSALINGGVTGVEITIDSEDAYQKISDINDKFGDYAVIGAGTVVNKEQAQNAIAAGAEFIFSPVLDRETIEYTKSEDKIMIPGAFSPTEIYYGSLWGADIIKVFPANTLGPNYLKDLNGPLPNIKKMPTGGINLDNIVDYFNAGAVAAGIGGSLLKPVLIEEENWKQLEILAKKYVSIVENVR